MNCNCIAEMDAAMTEHNTVVNSSIAFGGSSPGLYVSVPTMKLDTSKRGKAITLIASYCPFCGKGCYPHDAPVPGGDAEYDSWLAAIKGERTK